MEHREEEILRGEIYYVYPSGGGVGSEQTAGRPAIVVSNDKANKYSPVILMVYLTTQPKNSLPTHVDIVSATRPSIALCEHVHSVSKSRLGGFIAKCTDGEMAMIDGALCVSLGIELQAKLEPKKADEQQKEEIEFSTKIIGMSKRKTRIADLLKEIERLTEERNKYKGLYETMYRKWSDLQDKEFNCEALRKEKNEYFDKAVELQKQVDEYKDKIEQGTLIEQKTCKNISEMHPVDGFTCSECGISLEDYSEKEVDEENGDITYREYMLRYCPNCGAKVVEE